MTKVVDRKPLTFYERTYLPTLLEGLKVTARHFMRSVKGGNAALQLGDGYYPEVPWQVAEGYRGAPYLVRDQDGNTKCVSCQLCEFVCPPKAIRITPPGADGVPADRPNAEKMPREFEINMLRCIFCGLCQEVCPEEAIFLQKHYSLTGLTREEMIYDKERLLQLGGVHAGIQKWKHKLEEAREQDTFPVKTD
ncbi:MAG: NADH-quinone oxidoreductase subunit I [Verrucomicrobia bacterium]|nr:MAG: NADH-quinone oxidoreductase subunit I [Verrucomicrobiota bacterium]